MSNDPKKPNNGGTPKPSSNAKNIKKERFIGESHSHSEELRRGAEIVPRIPKGGGGGKKGK